MGAETPYQLVVRASELTPGSSFFTHNIPRGLNVNSAAACVVEVNWSCCLAWVMSRPASLREKRGELNCQFSAILQRSVQQTELSIARSRQHQTKPEGSDGIDGRRQTWSPQHVKIDQHVNKKAVERQRQVVESQLFQCVWARSNHKARG
jgi:hypothetical protein